jgi:RHS repeat-associated protein
MVPVRTYAWGTDLSGTLQGAGGVGGLLSVDNGSTNWFTAFDGNGNLTALVDSSDGSLDAVYEYDPYGDFLRASGHAAHANPFRFSTKYQDAESGLVYYGMRYFSPALGRWLNRDPLGELGGVNLIGFLANDSINAVDLLGLSVDSPTASFWSAIASGNLRYAAALLDAMLPTLTAEQAAALTAALAAAVAAQGLIDHLDEHIGKVTDLCRRNPAPGDPGWDPLDGWLREIRAVLKNLQQKLKQMPKNKKRRKPIEEAIKRAEDALEKAKDCKACE